MGRKFLTSAAIAAASLGIAAGSAAAAAPSPTTLSNGTKLSAATARSINRSMHKTLANSPNLGSAVVVKHGSDAECTVPEKNGGYENFFTMDTTDYLEFTGSVLVGDCSADLNDPQHLATAKDKPGPLGMVTIPKKYTTYSEACNIQYKGKSFNGDAESIVYPDGEFTETCIAPVTITP